MPDRMGDDHQAADQVRMLDRGPQRRRGAERVAHHVSLSQAEVPDEGGDVVAQRLEAHRAVHVRGAAVALQVDRYHPAPAGQHRQDRGVRLARGVAAVQQDERLARAVLFVVQGDAVDVGVAHRVTILVRFRQSHEYNGIAVRNSSDDR